MTTQTLPARVDADLETPLTRVDQVAATLLLSTSLLYGLGVMGPRAILPLGVYLAGAALGTAIMLATAPRGSVMRLHVSLSALMYMSVWMFSGLWSPLTAVWFSFARGEVLLLLVPMLAASHLRHDRIMPTILATFYFSIVWQLYGVATGTAFSALGFRGTFIQKNGLGAVMALAIVTIVMFEKRPERKAVGLTAATVLLLASTSATGIVMAAVGLGVVSMLHGYAGHDRRRGTARLVAGAVVAVAALGIITLQASAVLGLLGKNATLSGRTDVWPAVIDAIQDEPITGYGLSPWLNRAYEPGLSIVRAAGFAPANSHNTVLELLLFFGIIGLAPYLLFFFSVFVAGWRSVLRYPRVASLTVAACFMIGLRSYSEVTLGGYTALLIVLHIEILRRRTADSRAALDLR